MLQKLLTQLCGLNFCINYNSSARFEASIVKQRNGPKCTQTLRNKTKHEFRVQWGGSGAFVAKNSYTTSWTFALFALIQPILHRVSCSNQMVPNAPKHYETQQRMSLGSNGGGLGAFIVKTSDATLWHELVHSLHQFSPFCTEFHALTKWSKMHPNTMKRTKT